VNNRLHCQWCHRFEIAGTETHLCNKCGVIHQACAPCFKSHAIAAGTFPNYVLRLNACPPGADKGAPCGRCFPKG
jgi:hypothetical protein